MAFLGRSNVGKSSLLNRLVGQSGLAKTSQTPGCTQLINFFRVEEKLHLVDLPGYGYARVPRSETQKWRALIESYLLNRSILKLSVLLIDSRRGWMQQDRELRAWLEFHGRPYLVAATKIDKLNQKEEFHGLAAIREELGKPLTDPTSRPAESLPPLESPVLIPVSAHTGRGVKELWQTIWKRMNL